MSFQNKGCWLAKGLGSLNDGEMTCNNSSRIEPKRCNQWSTNGTETELFPNKKQAVELSNHHSFSELLNPNISPWGNTSGFQTISGNFASRLFDTETTKTINFDDGNSASVGVGNMNMVTKGIEDSFGNGFSFGLSISHMQEDPRSSLNYGGIRKVKVSQVKDSDNFAPLSTGHACTCAMPSSQSYSKADDSSMSMGLSFNRRDDNMISVGDTFNRENNNFILTGQSYDKGGESEISMGHSFKDNSSATSTGQSLGENNSNIVPMGEIFCKGNENTISMNCTSKVHSNAVSTSHTSARNDCNVTLMGQTFDNGSGNIVSVSHSYSKADENSMSVNQVCDTIDENSLSISHSFHKGESNIIYFGGYNDDDDTNLSGTLLCSYDSMMGQSLGQKSDAISITGMLDANTNAVVSAAQISACRETVAKKKDEPKAAKKAPPNNFPSNVRSLLSTGMLDGVRVKYTAWSREKELSGIIKGSGYLCGCQSCNYSKAINAYEFERHAACKTKHPNNHIYFENGKTIYGIVQELRNTPQNLLFEVIQTITGSPINQKSFRLWKESFLAATRELQRIYGKDEGKHLT